MPINPNGFYIKDTQINLWCTQYNVILENCGWGNLNQAVEFETQGEANNAIDQWGLGEQSRFIGQNPPPR